MVFVLAYLFSILPREALESQTFARHDDDDDKEDDDETYSNLNLWKSKMKILSNVEASRQQNPIQFKQLEN